MSERRSTSTLARRAERHACASGGRCSFVTTKLSQVDFDCPRDAGGWRSLAGRERLWRSSVGTAYAELFGCATGTAESFLITAIHLGNDLIDFRFGGF